MLAPEAMWCGCYIGRVRFESDASSYRVDGSLFCAARCQRPHCERPADEGLRAAWREFARRMVLRWREKDEAGG